MAPDTQFVHFLQQECTRLQDENKLLLDEVRALRRYITALRDLQETVQNFTPEKEILALLDDTLMCALTLMDATDGSLMLIDEETDELVFVLVHGAAGETLVGHRFDRREGIAGWAAEHIEPVIVDNVYTDPRFYSQVDEFSGFQTQSIIAVPLAARGRVLGIIEVVNKRSGKPFNEEDACLLSILATLSASALDYAASMEAEEETGE
ncbi:MAG TPA: GAF domain-containing protein [Chloroflexi bacterium]|nr:GAF domain-containing protein [Chloroflexota bacterium]